MMESTRLRAPTTYRLPLLRPRRRWAATIRRDTVANLVGRGWTALAALVFVPIYIELLGVEAYGLVGFAATLQVGISLLDVGLATTLNRELARAASEHRAHVSDRDVAQRQRDLVRTLEIPYWLAALLIVVVVELAAPAIAGRWLDPDRLPATSVENAIRLIGISIALQFPFTLYEGGLLGIGRQVALNTLLVVGATLRYGAVVALLVWVSGTIEAFFIWQVAITALQTAAGAWLLWSSLPKGTGRARFRTRTLSGIWRFAAGMTGITLSAVALTHMDKLVLSKLLSLTEFGYYTLASVATGVLYMLFLPLFQAVFPRFSQAVALPDERPLRVLYHRSAQTMSMLVLPAATVLALFAREIMLVWTQSPEAAHATEVVVALFAIGTALHGLMNIPYALQLAAGWTKLALYTNLVALAILVPTLVVLSARYGVVGAGIVWVALNVGYATIGVAMMHRRLLRAELARWYLADVGPPLIASIVTAGLVRVAIPAPTGNLGLTATIIVALSLTYVAAAASTPVGRNILVRRRWAADTSS